ncbi:MAG: beta-ketoacyl-ACP synthase I [Alphaproteobacteria bacterium]|nr:beta-ketoacyl-ACP synthase I [Alphaproteobacteria bacterium]
MRRVVVTGLGIVSSIGNNADEVTESLKAGRSGIVAAPEYKELGFRSQVYGAITLDLDAAVDRRVRRFMGDGAAYNYVAAQEAIRMAGLTEAQISNERTGLIMGSGGPSTRNIVQSALTAREKGPKKVGPFMVPRCMSSTNSANLSTALKIKGLSYSISSACSTSAHCIGNAFETIQWGKQDVMLAGGGEELDWTLSVLFDAMPAMSSGYNDTPARASRAYDRDRDGFVISGGGGAVVLEELEHAKARGATILAEMVGYAASSDGADMVAPSGEGAVRCMKLALAGNDRPIDYINTHGTSTPVGDITELNAIREVFGDKVPALSSTKSLTGHSQGATGAHEAVYSLLMLRDDFIAASANIENLDPGAEGFPIVRERRDNAGLRQVMSNSFGFGGTNAVLVFRKFEG